MYRAPTSGGRDRRVLFLDFDGVLNSHSYLKHYGMDAIDPEAVARLNYLVPEANTNIVISSTWRLGRGAVLQGLRDALREKGFRYDQWIIDSTPHVLSYDKGTEDEEFGWRSVDRGFEIDCWLQLRKFRGEFVILDDESMGRHALHLVQTDREIGLTDADVQKALDIFKRQSPWP